MPFINLWWKIKKILLITKSVFKNTNININMKRRVIMWEYTVVKLGSNSNKNTDILNKKSAEGWELVSTSPVSRLSTQNGNMVTDIQAFLRRKTDKSNAILG